MPEDESQNETPPDGTKKPTLPPGYGDDSDESLSEEDTPSGTKKPAGPPASSDDDAGTKKPTLPPGFGGDGAGGDGSADGEPALARSDFQSDQDVRWCPGCGDYAILSAVQRLLPELDAEKAEHVFVSGIGCAGRFPYYMDTYGMHSIHGRAPAIATGLKASRPELQVWVVTGDGDALSIGGNHLIHALRRNVDLQLLLFNNEIYGLTKGQYSPTSEQGKVTKSSPYGSIDAPLNPVRVALGADASFVARTMDRDPQHMKAVMEQSYDHDGAAFVEIYQNCNIFNDGAFFEFTEKETKPERALFLDDGAPMTFAEGKKGLRLDGLSLEVIDLENGRFSTSDCLVHDASDEMLAELLGRIFWDEPASNGSAGDQKLPRPFGVIYQEQRPTYEELLHTQIDGITEKKGAGDLDALFRSGETWTVE